MAKRKARSQIASLTPDQKKSEIDSIIWLQGACDTPLESFRWELQLCLGHISIWGLLIKLWGSKVVGVPTGAILGLPLKSPGREKPFGCRLRGQPQSIL